ncbi:CLUMA_CG012904, isoform A [Clunio marinus]|uniref:CLUMA_CG012904, isoform A n=1 Tax=Clunio marinus TaxID=568069 RepID=A0A1J1IHB2_9DIPT|nr:CLUMA_CG012904, isoform A [Clunio marinus]
MSLVCFGNYFVTGCTIKNQIKTVSVQAQVRFERNYIPNLVNIVLVKLAIAQHYRENLLTTYNRIQYNSELTHSDVVKTI